MDGDVIVVGSVNVDLIAAVERRPGGGETVLATGLERRAGGKGANQAAAAARAGASTVFVGAVGDDQDGADQVAELRRVGVDVSRVTTVPDARTGIALITVTPEGENSIVVASGANGALVEAVVLGSLEACRRPGVVVLQTEVSPAVVDAVAAWCAAAGIRVVLNDGPCIPLDAATLAASDPLVVNEHEARQLLGDDPSVPTGELATAVLEATRARSVVVTLGAAGVQVATEGSLDAIPAVRPDVVVDTTGAGDTFVGTLAAALAAGAAMSDAATRAAAAASRSVTWEGARPPHPLPATARTLETETH
jgi:ribokinase